MTARTRSISTVMSRCPSAPIVSFRLGLSDGVSVVADGLAARVARPRLRRRDRRRRRSGRRAAARARHPRQRTAAARRAGSCDRRRRRRGRREPLHDPAEPTGGSRRRPCARRTARGHASPRSAVATAAARAHDRTAAGRSRVATRRHQSPHACTSSRAAASSRRVIYNGFDRRSTAQAIATRRGARSASTPASDCSLHPVRAIPRKNIPAALRARGEVGCDLLAAGPAEDGYERHTRRAPRQRRMPACIHRRSPGSMPTRTRPRTRSSSRRSVRVSGTHRSKPPCTGGRQSSVTMPVADELRELGFCWFDPDEPAELEDVPAGSGRGADSNHNRQVAIRHFSHERMAEDIERLLAGAGWLP